MLLKDAGIPERPRPADMELVVVEPAMPPFPKERPRLSPRLLEVGVSPDRDWS